MEGNSLRQHLLFWLFPLISPHHTLPSHPHKFDTSTFRLSAALHLVIPSCQLPETALVSNLDGSRFLASKTAKRL